MRGQIRPWKLLALMAAALFLLGAESGEPPQAPAVAESVFSFQVALDGTALALPCPVQALQEAGWQTQTPQSEPFPPGMYGEILYQKESASITATVANLSAQPAPLEQCTLVGLSAAGNASPLRLAGGLSLGATRQQVLDTCGAPDRPLHSSGLAPGAPPPGAPNAVPDSQGQVPPEEAPLLRYTTARHSFLQFSFGDDGLLQQMAVQNIQPLPAPPDKSTLPQGVQAWTPPASLGESWQDFSLWYAGDLYQLPAPVSAFLENGWRLADEATVASGGWLMGVRLQKGNQILCAKVYNLSEEETALAGCFVTAVESSRIGTDVAILLPGNISRSSTMADIEAAFGPPHGTHQSATDLSWMYYSASGKLICQFWGEARTLYSIQVEYTAP